MDIWNPQIGDNDEELKHELSNDHDEFVITIFRSKRIAGHVPKNLSKLFYQFLSLPNCTIRCEVTGKTGNRGGGYGLEIPANYKFLVPDNAISWIQKM